MLTQDYIGAREFNSRIPLSYRKLRMQKNWNTKNGFKSKNKRKTKKEKEDEHEDQLEKGDG